MKAVITGGAGLVGSECCRLFADAGYQVFAIDNYMRGQFFGKDGSTEYTMKKLLGDYNITHINSDFRDEKATKALADADVVVHTAAQPSHPRSIEIPVDDFEVNARGTLMLLETLRKSNKDCTFVFCSTNKVYGDAPNLYAYEQDGNRLKPVDSQLSNGFDETLRTDRCMHTPFGVSKLAADTYVQEYGLLYGMNTGAFRMGCITGGAAMAVEQHNWEPFFVKKALTGEPLTIFGHAGYQVRDVIHARDLAHLFLKFTKAPRRGEVYNIGGGVKNSISLLEAIDLIEEITGNRIKYTLGNPREADHKWYISNIDKARNHFGWDITIDLMTTFTEIAEALKERLKPVRQ